MNLDAPRALSTVVCTANFGVEQRNPTSSAENRTGLQSMGSVYELFKALIDGDDLALGQVDLLQGLGK